MFTVLFVVYLRTPRRLRLLAGAERGSRLASTPHPDISAAHIKPAKLARFLINPQIVEFLEDGDSRAPKGTERFLRVAQFVDSSAAGSCGSSADSITPSPSLLVIDKTSAGAVVHYHSPFITIDIPFCLSRGAR